MFWCNNRFEISLLQYDVVYIMFLVCNGKVLFCFCVIYDFDFDVGIYMFFWYGLLLICFFFEVWCLICVEFVYVGFSNDDEGVVQFLFLFVEWNQIGVGLNEVFIVLMLLFLFFVDGYYWLEECEFYFIDGNGYFFWVVGNEK